MKKILFICEGTTEVFLLYKILKEEKELNTNEELLENGNLKISNIKGLVTLFFFNENLKIYIHNLEGKTKLNKFIEGFSKSRDIDNIEKILFIIDADFSDVDCSEKNCTGFDRTKESIENNIKIINKANADLKSEYFITPDNENDGMTENLIIDSLSCIEIVKYIKEEVIKKVKRLPKSEIKNEPKSTFLMIAATQNPLRGSAPAFLSKCYDKIDKKILNLRKYQNL